MGFPFDSTFQPLITHQPELGSHFQTIMAFTSALTGLLALSTIAVAQSTAHVDEATQISFQQWTDTKSGMSFGLALPETPGKDFIGQISAPITEGYAGISLGSVMNNRYQLVAFPNDGKVLSSLRMSTTYANPSVVENANVMVKTIPDGTSVTATGFTWTFLCEGCITGDSKAFDVTQDSTALGYAISTTALTDPTTAGAVLNYHGAGFGGFGLNLAGAKSAEYETWAKLAVDDAPTAPGAENPTPTPVPGNITTVISNTTYDYIVAGAGAAGIVVAERLAETGSSVLLIERGKASYHSSGGKAVMDWNNTVTQYDVPGMGYYLSSAKETDQYCTDTAAMAGCILGGTTTINAMMYVRPPAADFNDKWPAGWKWDDVSAAADRLYERTPGTTSSSMDGKRYDQGAFDAMAQWLSSNGFTEADGIDEPNKKHSMYTYPPVMVANGLRAGPVKDYLPLAEKLPNFSLTLQSKVVRVVRNGSAITGVEVETGPSTRQIINLNAGGSVILASGALSTPRILFNSGIGPESQISTVANGSTNVQLPPRADWIDLPVGQHLQDHAIFTATLKTKQPMAALPSTAFTEPNQTDVDLFAQGSGILAQSGQRLNYWSSVKLADGTEHFYQGTCNAPSNDTIKIKLYMTHGATSTGSLGITSSGNTVIVDQPYLNTDNDREAALAALQQIVDFASTGNSSLVLSGNATAQSMSEEHTSGNHWVGTARMGEQNDGSSVVDTDAKVWGTDNLFVVDASIHPDLATGNSQAIVMVAAEHAAQKIIGARGGSNNNNATAPAPAPVACKRSARVQRKFRRSRNLYV
ncbi:Cellobiose dehydrogenase [Paramyrothecium foliicola]|nr:Cellobiose dehydrogenase [Paramyrothecium foliicola]